MEEKILARRFTILRSLGHGGMSEVFLARDAVLSEEVALKVIHPHHARNPQVLDRFKKEVGISRMVHHPGIIRIYDLFELPEEDLLFLSMEYLPGGNLKTRIQTHDSLPASEVISLGVEALSALEAAHEAGIVHRDIKPHNLLFARDSRVRLTDFGLSRTCVAGEVLSDTASAGTPEYCAPEVALGEYADSRSDLYSLGITLFESLTGRLPFTGSNPYLILKHQTDTRAPSMLQFKADIPAELDLIIGRALEKDPSERFQTAAEFREALSELKLHAGPAPRHDYSCPVCGEPLVSTLPYCFRCRETVLDLVPAERKKGSFKVVILGGGKPGDKLPADDRSRILALVKREEISVKNLEKKIPRIPFVLISGIDAASAETLAGKISGMGIRAIATGRDKKENNTTAFRAMLGKVTALSPRTWLILLGSSGGLYGQIGNMAAHRFLLFLAFIFGALFVAVPGIIAAGASVPGVKFRETGDKKTNPFRRRILESAARLDSPVLQGLLKSAARKLDAIRSLLVSETNMTERGKERFTEDLNRSTDAWCGLLERIQTIEGILGSDSEARFGEEIRKLEESFLQTDSAAEAAGFEAEKRKLGAMMRDRRELERLRDMYFDVILKFTAGLDRAALKLSQEGVLKTESELRETAALIDNALLTRSAFLGLERAHE